MKKACALSLLFPLLLIFASACYAQQPQGEGFGRGYTTDVGDKPSLSDCSPRYTCAQTVQFKSALVNAPLPYRVIVPAHYTSPEQAKQRYPVIYLLHGYGGHYDNWVAKTKLKEYASRYQFIIVTPEGNNGWYTDSASAPAAKYESYILQELIPDVQRRYRAIETREGRAIAGLSMGGYGALKLGLKHPEMFAFAASMSGALGAAVWTESDLRDFGAELPRSIMETFGPAGSPTRAANDLTKLVREFPADRLTSLPYLYLDCGTEDGLLSFSRRLADLLRERKIPHEYRERPGNHNWEYWDAQVLEVLSVAAQRIPPARLSPVAQSKAAPSTSTATPMARARRPLARRLSLRHNMFGITFGVRQERSA
ncbi:MAG: putative tributyrin esterase [Blastocatellia bacterium]|jgi:S-formylglutathione hydrolase FrmB|nr:putative tributyrin esterase [Blastocatellia bacterium]